MIDREKLEDFRRRASDVHQELGTAIETANDENLGKTVVFNINDEIANLWSQYFELDAEAKRVGLSGIEDVLETSPHSRSH